MKPCKCGKDSTVYEHCGIKFVGCSNPYCWKGPIRGTLEEAESLWDEFMDSESIAVENQICCFGNPVTGTEDNR